MATDPTCFAYGAYTIAVSRFYKGNDAYAEACCPFCGLRFESPIDYGNSKWGGIGMKMKIVVHMKLEHEEEDGSGGRIGNDASKDVF